ncbi:4'-phosphopantetheinyl transferase family protein [Kaarinaea lacus]
MDSIARLDCKQATATVLGLALLGRGVEQLGVAGFSYKQLIFSSTQKPSCSLGIEFNIAHSANIAACAVSLDSPLGIDTETTGIHSAKLLRHVFNESELALIQNDNRHFLDLWVKKEAVAKASGDGVRAMKAIALDQERAHYNEQQWYLRRLLLDANEVSYLACQQAQPDIKLQEHAFADCLAFCTTAQFRDQHYG